MNRYHSHAIRSMYHRFGILEGDRNLGMKCVICGKPIKTINHFFFKHKEYYIRATSVIKSTRYESRTIEFTA